MTNDDTTGRDIQPAEGFHWPLLWGDIVAALVAIALIWLGTHWSGWLIAIGVVILLVTIASAVLSRGWRSYYNEPFWKRLFIRLPLTVGVVLVGIWRIILAVISSLRRERIEPGPDDTKDKRD